MIFIELGDRRFQNQAPGERPEALNKITASLEQPTSAIFNKSKPDGSQLALPPRWAKQEEPFSTQRSPATSAITCTLLIVGTASKSKLLRGLVDG